MKRHPVFTVLLLAALIQTSAQAVPEEQGEPDRKKLDRGITLAVAAEFEEALEIFEEILDLHPGHPLAHYYVGLTLLRLERTDGGIYHLEKSIAGGAEFPQVYFWLAQARWKRGDRKPAVETLTAGLERFPRNENLLDLRAALVEPADGEPEREEDTGRPD